MLWIRITQPPFRIDRLSPLTYYWTVDWFTFPSKEDIFLSRMWSDDDFYHLTYNRIWKALNKKIFIFRIEFYTQVSMELEMNVVSLSSRWQAYRARLSYLTPSSLWLCTYSSRGEQTTNCVWSVHEWKWLVKWRFVLVHEQSVTNTLVPLFVSTHSHSNIFASYLAPIVSIYRLREHRFLTGSFIDVLPAL